MNIDNLKIKGADVTDEYFQNILFPFFKSLKNNKTVLSDKEMKKLETILCGGAKGSSILFQYFRFISNNTKNKVEILDCLTQNNILSEGFILKLTNIIKYVIKKIYNIELDYTWLYNLNHLGFQFSEILLAEFKEILFCPMFNINEKINKTDIKFMELFNFREIFGYETVKASHIKKIKERMNEITEYMQKNTIQPTNNLLSVIYKYINETILAGGNIDLNNLMIIVINNIYKEFVKNGYQITDSDLNYLIDFYVSATELYYCFSKQKEVIQFENNYINLIQYFIDTSKTNNENIINMFINKFIKNNNEFSNNVGVMYIFQELLKNNKFIKISLNKLISIRTTYHVEEDVDDYNFDKFIKKNYNAETYYNLIKYIHKNNLAEFDQDFIELSILNDDFIVNKFMIDNNILIPNNYLMNLACSSKSIDVIEKFVKLKYIPTFENLTYCSDDSFELYQKLIEYGLQVDDNVVEYFISKNRSIIDLNVYGYNTPEKLEFIEKLCYKYGNFPYPDIKPSSEFNDVIYFIKTNANNYESVQCYEDNIHLFGTNEKKSYIVNEIYNKMEGVYFLKYMYKKYGIKADVVKWDYAGIAYY